MENILIGAGVSIVVGIFMYLFKKRFDSIDESLREIDKDLNGFKLHVAEKYVGREEHLKDLESLKELMKDGFNSIKESISSIHKRFDRFEEQIRKELDGKEDKK